MYIDNSGADGHELKIEVDGHEYTEQATESYHHDGAMDTAEVDGDDGGHTAYTDTDHDGTADLATRYDAAGHVVGESHYDAASGKWSSAGGSGMTVDTEHGQQNVGPATADTDGDGTNDTAVVTDADGNTFLYTDADGDGKADYAMEIAANGQVTISQHTGDHQWTQIEHGHLDGSGNYQKDDDASGLLQLGADDQSWGGAEQADGQGLVRTDSATGEWA